MPLKSYGREELSALCTDKVFHVNHTDFSATEPLNPLRYQSHLTYSTLPAAYGSKVFTGVSPQFAPTISYRDASSQLFHLFIQ